jgi:hypothetical protein
VATPLNENATRGAHFAAVRRSRAFVITTTVLALGALVAGAATAGIAAALIAPAVVVIAAFIVAFVIADRRAHGDFWVALAGSMGMTYQGETDLPSYTPLLGAGDRRNCPEWMVGKLADGRACAVGNYTFEERHENGDNPDTWTSYEYTLALIGIVAPEAAFVRGVYLRPRNRLRLFGERTLPTSHKTRMHTESAAFEERYDLYVDPDDDQARVLEILTPAFIDQLARQPAELCFDYHAGTLAVFVEDHSSDAGRLIAVLDAAKVVATRIDEELSESERARGLQGVRPATPRG